MNLKALFILTPILVLGFALTAPLQAQTDRASTDKEVLRHLVTRQMVGSLQSTNSMVRSQTLKNVIVYSMLDRTPVDLNEAVWAIAEVAQNDGSRSNRRLAVAALRAIDSYQARRYLEDLATMQDTEYRSLVAGVLSEYHTVRTTGTL